MDSTVVYRISHATKKVVGDIKLSSSKSLSNRLLLIKKIGQLKPEIKNPATSKDTGTLNHILNSMNEEFNFDVGHAGTAMRFLTALFAATEGERILTGSERMQSRPIGELVNALRQLGADIEYKNEEGYPPLLICGKKLSGGKIKIKGGISSQYISALLMISPLLDSDLEIEFEGDVVSKPYIDMTIELMRHFGSSVEWVNGAIHCRNTPYSSHTDLFEVEADWSSASYIYSISALAKESSIRIEGLSKKSLQADSKCIDIFTELGIKSNFEENGKLHLTKEIISDRGTFTYDFTECPDIAQTLAAVIAGLNYEGKLTGLKTLKIKETDRIIAIQNELRKVGIDSECTNESIQLMKTGLKQIPDSPIKTYHDHRMALAFAPLALVMDYIDIEDPGVIVKSYPEYWKHLALLGFTVEEVSSSVNS